MSATARPVRGVFETICADMSAHDIRFVHQVIDIEPYPLYLINKPWMGDKVSRTVYYPRITPTCMPKVDL